MAVQDGDHFQLMFFSSRLCKEIEVHSVMGSGAMAGE